MKKKKYKKKRMKTTNDNKALASEIRHNYVLFLLFLILNKNSINNPINFQKPKKLKAKKNTQPRKRITIERKTVCHLFWMKIIIKNNFLN